MITQKRAKFAFELARSIKTPVALFKAKLKPFKGLVGQNKNGLESVLSPVWGNGRLYA